MSGTRAPAPPRDLRASGRRLWSAVVKDFEPAEHERALLHEACRLRDTCDALHAVVLADGVLVNGTAGTRKANPAVSEHRQVASALARVLASLGLDEDGEALGPHKRGGVPGVRRLRAVR